MSLPGQHRTRFVGRVSEFAALLAVLDNAVRGTTGFALVGGEPGIGKTRLLAELGRLAGARGWLVLRGQASNAEGAPAFWPWRQIVRQWLASRSQPDGLDPAVEHSRFLGRIIPEFADETLDQRPGLDNAEDRFVAFERFGRLLADASAEVGLLLILDDVHWADAGSLSLLTSMVQDIPDCRLVVVGAFRPVEFDEQPVSAQLRTLIGRHRNGTVLQLVGLSTDEVGAQLAALLDRRPDSAVIAAVRERTQGNPLFVQEISRLLAAGLSPAESLPEVIREVIRQHLDTMSPAARQTLGIAAFLGATIEPGLLAAVTEHSVHSVLTHLDEAQHAGVLSTGPEFTFRHDLFRETLQEEVSGARRAEAHLRIALALEAITSPPPTQIARHRLAALPLGDAAVATKAAHVAGHAAMASWAFEEAAELFDAAVQAAPEDLPTAVRCELLIDAGKTRFMVRDTDGALERCAIAAVLAQQAGDPESLGHAALALPEFPEPRWTSLVIGWCEQALAGLPSGDSPLRAQLLAQLSLANVLVGSPAQIADLSTVALEMARRTADSQALLFALRARQLACASPDGHHERLELGSEMLRLGQGMGDVEAVFWGHLWRFDALAQAGRIDDAEIELVRLDPVAARFGRPVARWHVLRSRTAIEIGRGRFADAARSAHQQTECVPGGMTSRAPYWATAHLAALTGDNQAVLADPLPADFEHPARSLADFINLAPWYLTSGRLTEVADLYWALPEVGSPRVPHFYSMVVYAVRCQVSGALGDVTGAAAAYQALLPYADLHVVSGAGISVTLGSAHRYLGLAAAATGQADTAIDHFAAAVEANDNAGLRPFAALSRFHLAEALYTRGNAGDLGLARRAVTTAEQTAQQLGMAPLLAQAAALREQVTARPANPLTPRQRELAELLAQGRSNKQIAATLHLSERTVETHVRNIMITLGVASRVEVATWVATWESS